MGSILTQHGLKQSHHGININTIWDFKYYYYHIAGLRQTQQRIKAITSRDESDYN